jgi:hypothetical protein
MEARQGWLQTRSIWRHCTEVAQIRQLAPFGAEPALVLFRCQTAAGCTVSIDCVA